MTCNECQEEITKNKVFDTEMSRDLHNRLAQTENDVSQLKTGLAEVCTSLSNVSHNLDIVVDSMRELRGGLEKSKQTDWPTIIGILTLLFLFLGLIGGVYLRDLNRIEETQIRYEQREYYKMLRESGKKPLEYEGLEKK